MQEKIAKQVCQKRILIVICSKQELDSEFEATIDE
jgi:hypothetical protein